MVWVIIIVVLLAAFGPILYLVPSRRDRRLARVRQQARLSGFVVELHPVRQTNPELADRVSAGGAVKTPMHQSVGYTLMLPSRLDFLSSWRVLRDDEATVPVPGWQLDEGGVKSLVGLPDLLAELPGDVVGVELKTQTLTAFWLESPPAAEAEGQDLKTETERIMKRLISADELQRAAADDDEIP